MNFGGMSIVLHDAAGPCSNSAPARQVGVCLKSALTGSLTIYGMVQSDGTQQAWVIAPGSTGYQAPPGAGHSGGQALNFALSNAAADADKAVLFWQPA